MKTFLPYLVLLLLLLFFLPSIGSLVLIDLVFDGLLDFLELLLHILLIVGRNKQAFTLVLELPRVVVCLLLQPHRLGLVEPVAGCHEFVVCHRKLTSLKHCSGIG